jgi:hypothetical protein
VLSITEEVAGCSTVLNLKTKHSMIKTQNFKNKKE